MWSGRWWQWEEWGGDSGAIDGDNGGGMDESKGVDVELTMVVVGW